MQFEDIPLWLVSQPFLQILCNLIYNGYELIDEVVLDLCERLYKARGVSLGSVEISKAMAGFMRRPAGVNLYCL